MAQTIENLRMEVCEVFFKETSLGHTNGGVEIEIGREFAQKEADKYGKTPLDKVLIGNSLKVKVMLVETVKAILKNALPEGAYAINSTDDKLGIGSQAGVSMRQYAGLLRCHPVSRAGNDRSEDLYVFLAVSAEPISWNYKVDEQRVVECKFSALVDESQPAGSILGRIGDPEIS